MALGPKIIIWHGEHGDVYVDAATPLREKKAWLYLFELISEYEYYSDLEDDEKDAYEAALEGSAKDAQWLLEMRDEYEYERIEIEYLEQP